MNGTPSSRTFWDGTGRTAKDLQTSGRSPSRERQRVAWFSRHRRVKGQINGHISSSASGSDVDLSHVLAVQNETRRDRRDAADKPGTMRRPECRSAARRPAIQRHRPGVPVLCPIDRPVRSTAVPIGTDIG